MVPYSQRRHRLNSDEIEPVRDAALYRLLELLRNEEPSTLDEAQSLFRLWYRIDRYVRTKPSYPPHDTYELISAQLPYSTVLPLREDISEPSDTEEAGASAPRGAHTIGHTRTTSSQQNPTTDVLERSLTLKTTMYQVEEAEP